MWSTSYLRVLQHGVKCNEVAHRVFRQLKFSLICRRALFRNVKRFSTCDCALKTSQSLDLLADLQQRPFDRPRVSSLVLTYYSGFPSFPSFIYFSSPFFRWKCVRTFLPRRQSVSQSDTWREERSKKKPRRSWPPLRKNKMVNSSNGPAAKLPTPSLSYLSKVRIDQTGH